MSFFIPAIGALAGGMANMISEGDRVNSQNQNIDASMNMLKSDIIDTKGLNDLLLSNKRYYNAGISNLLNSTAISTKGVANAPVVAGAVASNLVGQEANAATKIQEDTLASNRNIGEKIAALNMQKQTDSPIADFFSGAVSGGVAGAQANKLMSMNPDQTTTVTNPSSTGQPTYTSHLNGFLPPTLSNSNPYRFNLGTPGGSSPFGGKANNPFIDYLGYDQQSLRGNTMSQFNYN